MEEGNVHSVPLCMEAAVKKIICVSGRAVSPTPQCNTISKCYWPKNRFIENVNILAPFHVGVDALRTIPIVVARSDVDRNGFDFSKCSLEEGSGIRRHPLVFVQVARTEERIRVDLTDKFRYPEESVPKRLPPASSGVSRSSAPSKRRIEM